MGNGLYLNDFKKRCNQPFAIFLVSIKFKVLYNHFNFLSVVIRLKHKPQSLNSQSAFLFYPGFILSHHQVLSFCLTLCGNWPPRRVKYSLSYFSVLKCFSWQD